MAELIKTYPELYVIFNGVCPSITDFRPYCKKLRNKATVIAVISQDTLHNIMGSRDIMISKLTNLLEQVKTFPVNAEAVHEGGWDEDCSWDIVTKANETDEEYMKSLEQQFTQYNAYADATTKKHQHDTFKNRFKTDTTVQQYNSLRHMLGLAKYDNMTDITSTIQSKIEKLEELDIIKAYKQR